MKVVVWAEIMANGFYPCYPTTFETPREVWTDFYAHVAEAGNVILGRKTVDEVALAGKGFGVGDALVVSISRARSEVPGVTGVDSPGDALEVIRLAGYDTAFVGGGATIINSFLAEGLAHELVILLVPAIGGRESLVALPEGHHRKLRLLSFSELGSEVLKVHYRVESA